MAVFGYARYAHGLSDLIPLLQFSRAREANAYELLLIT
jgi:hypothetical protein